MSCAPWWATGFPAWDLPRASPAKCFRLLAETSRYVQTCGIPRSPGYACHHNHNIIIDTANLVFQKVSRWPSKCTEITGTIVANKSQLSHFLRCSKLQMRIFLCHFYFFLHQEAGVFRQSRKYFRYLKVHCVSLKFKAVNIWKQSWKCDNHLKNNLSLASFKGKKECSCCSHV